MPALSDVRPPDSTSSGLTRATPRREWILDTRQHGRKLRCMTCQYARQAVTLDPLHTTRRVDLGRVVSGEEAVALEPARRHEDEDAKRRVAEAESSGLWRGVQTDGQVDPVNVPVHLAQLVDPDWIVRQFLDCNHPRLVQQLMECVVATNSPRPSSQYGDGCQTAGGSLRLLDA